jgi:transcriptional regulator of acetoin/glycerol metabolism
VGLRCVAAPVRDGSGAVVAALSLSSPTERLPRSAALEVAPVVVGTADAISEQLGWAGQRGAGGGTTLSLASRRRPTRRHSGGGSPGEEEEA